MIKKIKTWWFNREFDRYYNGLLMKGSLYDAKVGLLTDMKKNRELYLKNYLEKGLSIYQQLQEQISQLQRPLKNKVHG